MLTCLERTERLSTPHSNKRKNIHTPMLEKKQPARCATVHGMRTRFPVMSFSAFASAAEEVCRRCLRDAAAGHMLMPAYLQIGLRLFSASPAVDKDI